MPTGQLQHRERELAALGEVLGEAAQGRPALALIQGPRGIGKSELLRAALARLPQQSIVLRARCHENEQEYPYGVVRQLFDPFISASGSSGATPEPLSVNLPNSLDQSAVPANGAAAHHLLQNLFQATRSMATTRPVVIAIDDLDFADEASLQWCSYIARRLEGLPVALLATVSSETADVHENLPAELGALPYTRVVRPGPLCDTCSAELMAAAFGAPLDAELAAACHTLSQGNPLVLRELTKRLIAAPVSPGSPNLDEVLRIGAQTLSDTTLTWLDQHRPAAVELLNSLAILGPGADLTTAAILAGQGDFQAAQARAALCRTGLLDPGPPEQFRHELVRTAILSRIDSDHRLDLHERAAALLARLGAPATQTAEHLMSLSTANRAWALPILRTAADEAAAAGSWDTAARYLRRSLAESDDPMALRETTVRLGAVELHRDLASCVRYATSAAAAADPADRARDLLPLAHPALTVTSTTAARHFADTAAALSTVEDAPREQLLQLGSQALLAGHRVGMKRAVRELHAGENGPASWSFLGALAAMTAAGGRSPLRAARLAVRCTEAASPAGADAGLVGAVLAFAWTGRPAEAQQWSAWAVRSARRLRRPAELALALLVQSEVTYRREKWDESLRDAREAAALARAVNAVGLHGAAVACTARALVRLGQVAEAAGSLVGMEVPSDVHPLIRGVVLEGQGVVAAARGNHQEALRLFLECGHQLATRGIANQACVPWRAHAANSYQHLGEYAAARTIVADSVGTTARRRAGAGVPDRTPSASASPEAAGAAAAAAVRLSPAERRVTDLVLMNLSNLEVAERLCLSKRTVDTHLGRIYRKLGIVGRPELAAAIEGLSPRG
ncbi:AAA family ATPase [Streptomyces virginiae]|uniref:AAA family ATPase n=1 Tax=Streptomyces virginiae TaxID=1961 RepID=UPI002E2D2AA2|nr:AAA family ATPase [Streptomyces virginiae]